MNRRDVAAAGHQGDQDSATTALSHPEPAIRATAIGALERMGALQRRDIQHMLLDQDPGVRRRAAQAAARRADVDLFDTLHDEDWSVIEMACWAKGEHEAADQRTLARIVDLAATHAEPLVREAAVAALGAIGAPTGLPAVLRATHDKPAVRRRAAIALAAFEGPEVQAALERLLRDRDWQTRQVAEDLLQRP